METNWMDPDWMEPSIKETKIKFRDNIQEHFKYSYQEGNENDIKLLCADGFLLAGSLVLSYKSRFLNISICNARKNAPNKEDGPLELNFKLFPKSTVKMFLDMLYEVNDEVFGYEDLLKLLEFLTVLGYCDQEEKQRDFPCTVKMVKTTLDVLNVYIPTITNTQIIDLGLSMLTLKVEEILDFISQSFDRYITADQIKIRVYEIQASLLKDLDEPNILIHAISRYLKGSKQDVSNYAIAKEISKRSEHILQEMKCCGTEQAGHTSPRNSPVLGRLTAGNFFRKQFPPSYASGRRGGRHSPY